MGLTEDVYEEIKFEVTNVISNLENAYDAAGHLVEADEELCNHISTVLALATETLELVSERRHDYWAKTANRNTWGRLLSNGQKVLGLPILSPDVLEAMCPDNLDAQIVILKAELEKLNGPKLRAAEFELDESPKWAGFTYGDTWNGWAMPLFTKVEADDIIAWFNSMDDAEHQSRYCEKYDGYILGNDKYNDEDFNWDDDDACKATDRIWLKDEVTGLYGIGSGSYIWTEVEETEEDNEA